MSEPGRINKHKTCAWCSVGPLTRARAKYCSDRCRKDALYYRLGHPVGVKAPLCHWCEEKTVLRAWGQELHKRMGPRVIDGIRWRWFCSKKCNGQHRGGVNVQFKYVAAARATNIARARQRLVQRLVDAVKPHMDEQGKVPAMEFVQLFIKEIRRERINAASVRYQNRQKERVA